MASNPPPNPPRKPKFLPKAPPRRAPKVEVKSEKDEDIDTAQAMNLMKQFQERSMRAKPKSDKKVKASEIAFGFGASSTKLKSFGVRSGATASNQDRGSGGAYSSGLQEKEYTEPWDYYSYYPVTLPLRRPYSGDPAILDLEEFGEDAETANYDENSTNAATDLGLMEENIEPNVFFLQLPPTVPTIKRSAVADGQEVKENSKSSGDLHSVEKSTKLEELPAGYMGKMIVYKSGAVKLKLGDTLYDVSPGMDCTFARDVLAINTAEKHCCTIAEINKHATITPDVDFIIKSVADL